MIIHGVNGDKSLNIEIHPTVQLGSRFDTVTLSANDFDTLGQLSPAKLREWVIHIRCRFPPSAFKAVKPAEDEIADLLS